MCKVNTVDNIATWTAQITESFQSYQRPFRYLGVFPFIESTGTTKVNRLALAWSYSIGTVILALSLQYLVISPTTFELPKILVIISKILSITVATSQIVSVTFLIIYRHTLNSAFQILRQIGRKLSGLNPNFSFKYPIFSITLLIITLVLLIIYSPSTDSLKENSVFWLTTFFIHIIAYLFTRTILLIKYCFNFITKSLKQETNNLPMLLDCYDLLLNCCDDFNKCFGPSLLTIMTSCFCILTFDFYLLFSTKYNDIYVNLRSIIGVLLYINLVMHVIWASHSTVKEAESFKDTISRFAYEGNSDQIVNNRKAMILLTSDKTVVFSACDLFDMDFKMVCSMAAGITTYIVVLIQMGNDGDTVARTSPAPSDDAI